MGRTYIPAFDKEMSKRLRSLIVDSRAIAEHLGCSAQAISQYRSGASRPSLENIAKIAEFYNTTTDYLLGLPWGVKSRSPDLQAAVDYTGLDENAAERLHSCADMAALCAKGFVSDFINNLNGGIIGRNLMRASSMAGDASTWNFISSMTADGRMLLDTEDGVNFTRFQIETELTRAIKVVLDSYYGPITEKLKEKKEAENNAVNPENGD